MPRSNPLPNADREIGQRLAEARKELLIPRTAMAVKLGISTDRLISYEFGRVKLPWRVADEVVGIFKVSPLWLFDGTGPKWWQGIIDVEGIIKPAERATFAEVMANVVKLMPDIHAFITSSSPEVQRPTGPFLTPEQTNQAWGFAKHQLSGWLEKIHPDKASNFLADLTRSGEKLVAKYR